MSATRKKGADEHPLVLSLSLVDPLLQFLTKRSGKTSVPLSMLRAVLPGGHDLPRNQILLQHIPELADLGILRLYPPAAAKGSSSSKGETSESISWDTALEIGFPSPPMRDDDDKCKENSSKKQKGVIQQAGSLCGSTKTAANRRLAALKRSLKALSTKDICKTGNDGEPPSLRVSSCTDTMEGNQPRLEDEDSNQSESVMALSKKRPRLQKTWDLEDDDELSSSDEMGEEDVCQEARLARGVLQTMFRFEKQPSKHGSKLGKLGSKEKSDIPQYILPKQASYAGSHPAQMSTFGDLSQKVREKIPTIILNAFGIVSSQATGSIAKNVKGRRLYSHQVKAISSAIQGRHTLVCTSTGSGKSLVSFQSFFLRIYCGFLTYQLSHAYFSFIICFHRFSVS